MRTEESEQWHEQGENKCTHTHILQPSCAPLAPLYLILLPFWGFPRAALIVIWLEQRCRTCES